MNTRTCIPAMAGMVLTLSGRAALAQNDPTAADAGAAPADASPAAPTAIASASEGTSRTGSRATVTLAGYVEALYQWNFNNPSNGITNYRGFDTRHNAFTVSNVVLDATGVLGPVSVRLALQVGSTPETYYLAEPDRGGAGGAGAANLDVWKFIQQAVVAWRAPVGRGLLLEAGIFLSPIGPEGMAVKDQWNWSRSNLFFGLPFYHTGMRASYPLSDSLTLSLAGYNGWNSVVDNNDEKSVSAALDYVVTDRVTFHALYFGGVERAHGAPESTGSRPWRHIVDSYLAVYPTPALSLMVHGNAGVEPNAFGTSWWAAGALYARLRLRPWLYLAARGDYFRESAASNASGTASNIFWPTSRVGSGTATLDARPHDNVSIRLEYRHDEADGPTYFRGAVTAGAMTGAFVPNSGSQDTLTLGVTTWF